MMIYRNALSALACLLFAIPSFLPLQAQEESTPLSADSGRLVTVVKSKGQGETPEKAERSALLRAVVKAVGTLVDQETLIKSDELIRDQIISVSSGFVKSFKVLQEPRKNLEGDYEIVLEVVVEKNKLEKSLSEKGLVKVSSNAKDVWVENLSKNASAEDAIRALEAKLPSLLERLYSVSFFEESPKPVLLSRDSSQGTAKLLWWVKMSADVKFWYSQFAPLFEQCLSAIIESERDDVSIRSRRSILVAMNQPLLGAEVVQSDFKVFTVSDKRFNEIRSIIGFPFLDVTISSHGDVVVNCKLNPQATPCSFSEEKDNFYRPQLGNMIGAQTGNFIPHLRQQKSSPVVDKFIESKPENIPLGCLFFSFPADQIKRSPESRNSWHNHIMCQIGLREFVQYKYNSNEYNHVKKYTARKDGWAPFRATDVVFTPEVAVHGTKEGSACWWRAPRPGVVAFPIILDVPIEETKGTLEVSVGLKTFSAPSGTERN
jgi:hypothetical protein